MHRSALVALLLAAVLLAGCGGADTPDESRAVDDRSSEWVEPSAPKTSAPAEPSDDGTIDEAPDAPAPTGDRPGGGDTAGAGGEAPGGEVPGGEVPGQVVWPSEVTPMHGARVWAVYLAVGSPIDEWQAHKLGETESYIRGLGYVGSGIGSVTCDQGAAEQLGFDPDDHRVAVYFDSAARAQEFVAVYDRQDVGSAEVTTYCLD